MCDTFVVTSSQNPGGTILAKNSDREPNEAQAIERIPARQHDLKAQSRLKTTYIEVDQVSHTFEILISRPFHMWGAEMGVNEHGVAIGNEAVFTRIPFQRTNSGLTGMDMIRLALERSRNAEQAIEVITSHLEKYGQDACGGYQDRKFYYHNSFLIADPGQAYILETAGPFWVAKKVEGHGSISNGLTIGTEYDLSSNQLEDRARKEGYLKPGKQMHFAQVFSDSFYTRMSACKYRQARSFKLAGDKKNGMSARDAMGILRSHGDADGKAGFHPSGPGMKTLCLHASGIATPSQTTGSMVAQLTDKGPIVWLTGTAAPCLSTFKPFFFGDQNLIAPDWVLPGSRPDESLWWMHERLHRAVLGNYMKFAPDIQARRDALEYEFISRLPADAKDSDQYSRRCLHRSREVLRANLEKLGIPVNGKRKLFRGTMAHPLYSMYWGGNDRKIPSGK
ncbi:MAG: C69 family dipeptidase [Leptospiraceae bacterium]|nr:C69 family dipeptidase [Leptospiraceae bacterium]MCB1303905.1 C69 family dipeptidase [Leptospiraceae bacterium]